MHEPDLSVVIISYNTRAMTEECLSSVFANLGQLRTQVIVVDNNSQDGSVAMIRERFPQVSLISNADNKGFAAANNQGFKIANGRYVLLLNSDTIVLGDVLSRSVEYMKDHPEVGAFGCRVLNSDRTLQFTCSGYPTIGRLLIATLGIDRLPGLRWLDTYQLTNWRRDDERNVEVVTGCYLLVPKDVIDKTGGLDEQFFFFGEETDWCLQIRKAGLAARFAPVGEIVHHQGGSVKKLNHKRDVMLTSAMVRLHAKNGGRASAAMAFSVLALFNVSRAVYWGVRALRDATAKPRALHFRRVVGCTLETWPKD